MAKRKHITARSSKAYKHPEASSPMRPDVGTQAQFKKNKPPAVYRYDSSLSPILEWDGQNGAREAGEALIQQVLKADSLEKAKLAAAKLRALSRPFLNWAGKAERLSFDVPTLPLFVHERLSTRAILETLKGHHRDKQQSLFDLFSDPQHPIADQVLRAYEHRDKWVNRMVLGDSLVVINSLLNYEALGGQVQMIYMDPPYGVRFGSNFQPFVRKRDVSHNDDEDMTREPEMVKAYRDTWEFGLHSYLTYLRDRVLLCRELLTPSGSMFVQIGDENVHHVREVMDEVFGEENFCALIAFTKAAGGLESVSRVGSRLDYLVWYARDIERIRYTPLFERRADAIESGFTMVELADGSRRTMTSEERGKEVPLPEGSRPFMSVLMTKPGPGSKYEIEFNGRTYNSGKRWWGTTKEGLEGVIQRRRVIATENSLRFVRYFSDFQFASLSNLWDGLGGAADPIYVVQTSPEVIRRCMLMTTLPGDLVLDPTCGSGTTAYVAEQWGRRWITIDTSRVPLALARQRLLTATFPWFELKDESRGPAAGLIYKRKQNKKGEEIGGIVPHITLKSIANDEPPEEEILVDRPEEIGTITRVSGPFTVEATIPTPIQEGEAHLDDSGAPKQDYGSFVDRMIEVLRKSPVLRLEGNRTVTFKNVRPPAKTLSLFAEALVANGDDKPVAFVFGPENAAVSERLVYEAGYEARGKGYTHLYVIGFAIQPNARSLADRCAEVLGIPATYVQATPDLMMGDLLKNMRSSEIFSVCGLPEIGVRHEKNNTYQVDLLGLDVFDPLTMQVANRSGDDVPAWFLDTDYNGLSFHVCQAFFPRTSAWENLKRALKSEYEESVWEHLAGTTSAPFDAGEHRRIAVKVIDDRGNELLVMQDLPK